MVDFHKHLQENKYSAWFSKDNKPQILGESYLVMLDEDNSFGYTHTSPIIAEFGFFKNQENWTVFNYETGRHENADNEVICWMPLPKPPKQEFLQHLEKCKKQVKDWPAWKNDNRLY